MSLWKISFISVSTVLPMYKLRHSFVKEAAAARWDIRKFRKNLWGTEFMVLSDCRGLKKYLNRRLMYLTWYTGGEPNF